MQENIDYVFVENAKTVGRDNFMEQIKGLFVGTKNYFFFFPEKSQLIEKGYAKDTITDTTYSYMGKPVPEYIKDVLITIPHVREFEELVVSQLNEEMGDWIRVFPMEKISEFKVNAGLIGSGIVARFHHKEYSGLSKNTATPVALGLGKKKKDIKSFYSSHLKIKK